MKTKFTLIKRAALLLLLSTFTTFYVALNSTAFAQGTAFTYQGQLQYNGNLASGTYNLTFTLFTTNTGGTAVAGPVTNNGVVISNGLFTVLIDFGPGVFTGATNWLEIGVESNGVSSFTTLSPRQQLTPTPYAITAENVNGGGLAPGTYGNVVTFSNAANSFSGSGAGLTALNASQLTSGTVADARLSANVALRAGGNTFTGNQIINTGNLGIGTPNPSAVLQVHTTGLDQQIYVSSGAPSVTLGNDAIRSSATMSSAFVLATDNGDYGLNAGDSLLYNLGNSRGNFYIDANYSGTGTKNVIIQPSSGNVGIGTTTPSYTLDVNGTAFMEQTLLTWEAIYRKMAIYR